GITFIHVNVRLIMQLNKFLFVIVISLTILRASAQEDTDAIIVGHVVSGGEHIPFVNIYLEGTNYGTATDVTGHYMMTDLPLGEHTLIARMVGYKQKKKTVSLKAGSTVEVNFELEEDLMRVNEVV